MSASTASSGVRLSALGVHLLVVARHPVQVLKVSLLFGGAEVGRRGTELHRRAERCGRHRAGWLQAGAGPAWRSARPSGSFTSNLSRSKSLTYSMASGLAAPAPCSAPRPSLTRACRRRRPGNFAAGRGRAEPGAGAKSGEPGRRGAEGAGRGRRPSLCLGTRRRAGESRARLRRP